MEFHVSGWFCILHGLQLTLLSVLLGESLKLGELANQVDMALGIEFTKLPGYLSKQEIRDLVKFLKTMTAPNIQKRLDATIPDSVPSGLPLDG